MIDKLKVLITGGNRGLGFALADAICKMEDNNTILILAARCKEKGRKAVADLKEKYPDCCVLYQHLDLCDQYSIRNLVDWIHVKLGSIDVVVNNAGQHEGFGYIAEYKQAVEIFQTNLLGVINLNEQLLPILSPFAKVIFMSSRLAITSAHEQVVEGILNNPSLTLEEIKAYANDYVEMIHTNKELWNQSSFITSKSLMNAYVRHEFSKKLINEQMAFCVCPGWCQTDMGGKNAPNTVLEGIQTTLHLLFQISCFDRAHINGRFFADKNPISY